MNTLKTLRITGTNKNKIMEVKFKGIINHTEFINLTLSEKHQVLVDNNIYVKGSLKSILNEYEIDSLGINEKYYNTSFFGKNLKINNIDYKLNKSIIDEIFILQKEYFKKIYNRCEYNNEIFKKQLYYYSKEEIETKNKQLIKDKSDKLRNKIFIELDKQISCYDTKSSISILKNYIVYDSNLIYDYLISKDNDICHITNSILSHTYHSYLHNSFHLNSLNEINRNYEEITNSLPKKIALLQDLGLFDTDKFKSQIETDKYKLLAFLFNVKLDNVNKINDIRRNYTSLSIKSKEDTNKYTASKHIGKIINEILGNSN